MSWLWFEKTLVECCLHCALFECLLTSILTHFAITNISKEGKKFPPGIPSLQNFQLDLKVYVPKLSEMSSECWNWIIFIADFPTNCARLVGECSHPSQIWSRKKAIDLEGVPWAQAITNPKCTTNLSWNCLFTSNMIELTEYRISWDDFLPLFPTKARSGFRLQSYVHTVFQVQNMLYYIKLL